MSMMAMPTHYDAVCCVLQMGCGMGPVPDTTKESKPDIQA